MSCHSLMRPRLLLPCSTFKIRINTERRQRICATARAERFVSPTLTLKSTHTSRLGAATLSLGAGVASLLLTAPAAQAAADKVFSEDFDVSFLGLQVDHKLIIYLIVLGQFVGFVGATVSGLEAKARKVEVEALNERLIGVNKELRKLAREGKQGIYSNPKVLVAEKDGVADDVLAMREKVISGLRSGKQSLRDSQPKMAEAQFTQALKDLAESGDALEEPWKAERKAYRGLGSAAIQMGQHQKALGHMQRVLEICEQHSEEVGTGDALGVIADIYTDIGDMEKAAIFYDKYLLNLATTDA